MQPHAVILACVLEFSLFLDWDLSWSLTHYDPNPVLDSWRSLIDVFHLLLTSIWDLWSFMSVMYFQSFSRFFWSRVFVIVNTYSCVRSRITRETWIWVLKSPEYHMFWHWMGDILQHTLVHFSVNSTFTWWIVDYNVGSGICRELHIYYTFFPLARVLWESVSSIRPKPPIAIYLSFLNAVEVRKGIIESW